MADAGHAVAAAPPARVARLAVSALLFAAVVALLAVGLTRDPRLVPSPLLGKPIPAFALPRLREPSRLLDAAALRGQVSLLNVWATWCVPCRQEHDMLLRIARTDAVPIYGLNYKDSRDDALRWLDRLGDPYVASGFDHDGRVALDFGVYGAPETYVVDAAGRIAYKHIGPITEEVWHDRLAPIVRGLTAERG